MNVDPYGSFPPLAPLAPLPAFPSTETAPTSASGFARLLQGMIDQNAQASASADAAVSDLAAGRAQDLHTVSLAVSKADLSFRVILELRNRLTEAYQEIQRMQV